MSGEVRPRISSPSWFPDSLVRYRTIFLVLLALTFVLRFIAMIRVPLIPEEAYYWLYAQHPSLSYYDHPPMVAWVIWLGTTLFGNTEFGVRIVNDLLMMLASVLVYVYGRMWFTRGAAILAALALQVLPLYFGAGFITTMDSALLFFWTLCLIGVTLALKRGHSSGWLLAGVALGGALLSKYTGIFLLVGTLLMVVARRDWRRQLLSPYPYIAVLIAAAMFSPVVIWNSRNEWASFRFQFVGRFTDAKFSISHVMLFIGVQFVAATPVILWGCLRLCARWPRNLKRFLASRWLFTMAFSLPLLAATAQKSLRSDVKMNWTLPVFVSLLAPMAQIFLAKLKRMGSARDRDQFSLGVVYTALVCVSINLVGVSYVLCVEPYLHKIPAFGPWQTLARVVDEHSDKLEAETGHKPLVIARGKNRVASELAFYRAPGKPNARASDFTTSQWILGGTGVGFPYWTDAQQWIGRDCLLVLGQHDSLEDMTRDRFNKVELIDEPRLRTLPRGGYKIAVCRGLRKLPTPLGSGGPELDNSDDTK